MNGSDVSSGPFVFVPPPSEGAGRVLRSARRISTSGLSGRASDCYALCVTSRETPSPAAETLVSPVATADAEGKRRRFFLIWGFVALGVTLLFRAVLLPFFLAVILAYVFEPVVAWLERRSIGTRQIPRWVAVISLYVLLLVGLGVFVARGGPRLAAEVRILTRDVPAAITHVRNQLLPKIDHAVRAAMSSYDRDGDAPDVVAGAPSAGAADSIRIEPLPSGGFEVRLPTQGIIVSEEGDRLRISESSDVHANRPLDITSAVTQALRDISESTRTHAGSLFAAAQTAIQAIIKGIFTFSIMLMLSAYILVTKVSILDFFRTLVREEKRARFDTLLRRIDKGLSGVVRGQLLICLVNGVLSGIGFYLLELRYWPILTLVATVLSIIPIFGAILSSVPAVVIGLQTSFTTGALTLVWILVIHQIEANLLNPKILGDSAKVHPVLVVFALLAGEHLFGIAGALLAVPVLSITQSIFLHNRESALGIAAPKADRTQD